jgi:hypothetical protein
LREKKKRDSETRTDTGFQRKECAKRNEIAHKNDTNFQRQHMRPAAKE